MESLGKIPKSNRRYQARSSSAFGPLRMGSISRALMMMLGSIVTVARHHDPSDSIHVGLPHSLCVEVQRMFQDFRGRSVGYASSAPVGVQQ
jgi:hypothetical protein